MVVSESKGIYYVQQFSIKGDKSAFVTKEKTRHIVKTRIWHNAYYFST